MPNDNHFKIILVGDCRVGKTSYLHTIVNKESKSNQNPPPTIGIEYAPTTVKVSGQSIKINLWDTSGAEKYKSVTSSYYRKCQGAILMFDLTNQNSFKNLEGWFKEIEKRISRKMCIVVVANKMDLVESGEKERKVPEKDIVDLCLRHSVTYKCASALTGLNVQESFEELVQKIYDEYQTNNTVQQEMISVSLDNNQDYSFLPRDAEKKAPRLDPQESSSCPKCC